MESQEIQLFTGKRLTIRPLNGLEEQNIDDMIPAEKFMSLTTYRAIATIESIDGKSFPRVTSLVDLKDRVSQLSSAEKNHLIRIVTKRFGIPDTADDLGNVSAGDTLVQA